jgi:hypothetical protein
MVLISSRNQLDILFLKFFNIFYANFFFSMDYLVEKSAQFDIGRYLQIALCFVSK